MPRLGDLDPTAAARDVVFGPRTTHGIRATYARGCRCDECRAAWREVRRVKERERARRRRIEEAQALLREEGLLR